MYHYEIVEEEESDQGSLSESESEKEEEDDKGQLESSEEVRKAAGLNKQRISSYGAKF